MRLEKIILDLIYFFYIVIYGVLVYLFCLWCLRCDRVMNVIILNFFIIEIKLEVIGLVVF